MDFFDTLTGEPVKPDAVGQVWKLPNGYWQAIIGRGWWVAQAKTKKGAIKKVKKLYEDERYKAW